jgi:3-oxoacyl-[acyl-carrier protein] reductase
MGSQLEVTGHVAIVTGAGSGIGLATAQKFAAQGVRVVCVDLRSEAAEATAAAIREGGGSALARHGDVSDPGLAPEVVDAALERFGRLDILVNNAGAGSRQVALWDIELDDWHRDLEVNLTSQFLFCKAAVPHMIEAGYGRIVNVASAAGMEGHAMSSPYAAAKAGVVAMTKALGKELAKTGVLVNAIAPALIGSAMLDAPWFSDEVKTQLLSRIPMGRVGEPAEVAEMIGFLASPALSFSTGAVFDLSGGRATY